jgi:hypothetical protein
VGLLKRPGLLSNFRTCQWLICCLSGLIR